MCGSKAMRGGSLEARGRRPGTRPRRVTRGPRRADSSAPGRVPAARAQAADGPDRPRRVGARGTCVCWVGGWGGGDVCARGRRMRGGGPGRAKRRLRCVGRWRRARLSQMTRTYALTQMRCAGRWRGEQMDGVCSGAGEGRGSVMVLATSNKVCVCTHTHTHRCAGTHAAHTQSCSALHAQESKTPVRRE